MSYSQKVTSAAAGGVCREGADRRDVTLTGTAGSGDQGRDQAPTSRCRREHEFPSLPFHSGSESHGAQGLTENPVLCVPVVLAAGQL